ncbi:MAG: AAA family ATPase [Cyanobacteria bacterium REEB67]|nr:AAA family ATPase [Cyanobacteria bacterium REEB67]
MDKRDYKFVSSGNAQMDQILNGGFPANSLNIIMGQPGTGKTVFAEQMVFYHARENDRPILYLTTLSEPLSKVLTYLQRFSFFDQEKVNTAVQYQDIGFELAQSGVGALQKKIYEAIHEISPKIIVIDSFRALHDLIESPKELRQMLHELTSTLTAYETTVFLVGEYTEKQSNLAPEFAIADGIVEFLRNPLSTRDERFVRVLKLRGSSYHEGMHGFRVTSDGLEIFPRLVSPPESTAYTVDNERVSSGITGLDKLLDGGFLKGSTCLLAGPTGSGKTTAALQFAIDGVRKGEASLYVNFQENPSQLARSISNLGADYEQLVKDGLHLYYMSPVELQIDSIVVKIFSLIGALGVKRIVVDAVGDLITAAVDANRIHDYLYSLNQAFSAKGVTTILTFETLGGITGTSLNMNGERFSYMADSVILLNVNVKGERKRTLAIVKQRASAHDLSLHEMRIARDGVRILD